MPLVKRVVPGVTADDLLQPGWGDEPGELWDGVLYVHEYSGGPAEVVGGRILGALGSDAQSLGWVTGSNQGFYVARNPDRVLCPDVAFTSFASLPKIPERGFIERPPDFAVEVRSPYDSGASLYAKAGVWVGHRVPVVWAVDPKKKTVVVLRPGQEPVKVRIGGRADAAPVLPDFSIDLASLFDRIP